MSSTIINLFYSYVKVVIKWTQETVFVITQLFMLYFNMRMALSTNYNEGNIIALISALENQLYETNCHSII